MKFIHSVLLGCTSSNQRTSKLQTSMSQNGDPKLAISFGIYSIEGPDVGFMRGGSMYTYIYICIYVYVIFRIHIYIYAEREIDTETKKRS